MSYKKDDAEDKKKDKDEKQTPGGKTVKPPLSLIDKIHAFMFVYDSSNKRTFDAMMCMVEVISELEKAKKKGANVKTDQKKSDNKSFYPKLIIVGNKKDLRKDRNAGIIKEEDIAKLEGVKIKEVSALTNSGINDVFKVLIGELNADPALAEEAHNHFNNV